ncbi:MAG: DUF2125 domain-containing protein [Boseongicola sp.]
MGRLIVVILTGALIWMVWWAFGSTALDRSLTAWVDARRAEGWAADVENISVKGFPNRFDTTLTEVHLADPDTGVAWAAPFFQILALAYKPYQVIAVLPPEHRLSTPMQTLTISNEQATGSIFFKPNPSLPLDRSTIVVDGLAISSSRGWETTLEQGRFATEPVPARPNAHRIGAEITGLIPSKDVRKLLDPAGILPVQVERLRVDAAVGFTTSWDRSAIEVARPQITDIDLGDLSAVWGNVTFRAAGELTVDETGLPSGEITVKAVEWRRLLEMAVATGLVAEPFAPTIERGLELLAALKGPADTIDAPLTFAQGNVSLGLIPLGPAPRLIIR